MGNAPSQEPNEVGVIAQYRSADNKWIQLPYKVFDETATMTDVQTVMGIGTLVPVASGETLVTHVRGEYAYSPYVLVSSINNQPNETLDNLSIFEPSGTRRLFLRFSSQVCSGACSGALGLQFITDNLDSTYTLTFTDGSTAVVAETLFGGSGPPGPPGPPGADGAPGADGNSITSIINNGDGTVTINMTNLPPVTTSDFTGPQGNDGTPGQDGNDAAAVTGFAYDDNTGVITVTLANGGSFTTGDIRNPNAEEVVDFFITNIDGSTTVHFIDGETITIPALGSGLNDTGLVDLTDNLDGTITMVIEGSPDTTVTLAVATTATFSITVEEPTITRLRDGSLRIQYFYSNPNDFPVHIPSSSINNFAFRGSTDLGANVTEWFLPGSNVPAFEYTTGAPATAGNYGWTVVTPGGVGSSSQSKASTQWETEPISGTLKPLVTMELLFDGTYLVWFGFENTYKSTVNAFPDSQEFFIAENPIQFTGPTAANTNGIFYYSTTTPPTARDWDPNLFVEFAPGKPYIQQFPVGRYEKVFSIEAEPAAVFWWVITANGQREIAQVKVLDYAPAIQP